MVKWIQFQDSATDCHWVPVKDINAMLIAGANDLIVKFRNYTKANLSGDTDVALSDHTVTITASGKALALGTDIADYLSGTKVGGGNCLVIKAYGDGISSVVQSVAFTIGA